MVDVQNLARRFGSRWALAGVTFHVPAGTVMIVSGRNGAGKSTLLRLLATAIRPDSGTVTIAGHDAVRSREDIRKSTALLAHQSYLYESLTAAENLEVVAGHMGIRGDAVVPLLERVGLERRSGDQVSTFSAGMRKRLSFARLLLQSPRVALLDEPYGALDPPGFELVDTVLGELKRDGVTVVMATHQTERAARLADATIVLEEGRIVSRSGSC